MQSLLNAASTLACVPSGRAVTMACIVTGSAGETPVARGHSGLNHDGTPLQLCVTIDGKGARYRLLGDPASDVNDIALRLGRSLAATESLLPLAGAEPLEPLVRTTLSALIGDADGFDPARHPDGVLWLAGQLDGPGLALYVDARNGGIDAVARLREWLKCLADPTPDMEALLAAVARGRVMSAGIEGVAPGYARAKIYWRLNSPSALSDIPVKLFAAPAFAEVVTEVIGSREIPLDGIVLSTGLAIPGGRLADVKLDICCCPRCVSLGSAETVTIARRLAAAHGLQMPDIAPLAASGDLAFIGFGLTRKGDPRLNLYFKPRLAEA